MVSAGNTGAAMASALLRMGRIKGVSRPAIATVLPVPGSSRATVLLDAGANAECQPEWLVQFAQMGSVFARHRFGLDAAPGRACCRSARSTPRATPLVKETHALLEAAPGVRFIGNVEGRDILTDDVDIVVTDGFSGNVVLKALEGALQLDHGRGGAGAHGHGRAGRAASSRCGRRSTTSTRAWSPRASAARCSSASTGVCIISHGSSSAKAVVNAIKMAREMVVEEVVAELRAAVTAD